MLKIYNTLTKKEEEFKPIKNGEVGIYSCGPTVYGMPHIGNYRAFVFADILRRYFEFAGFKVNHVRNITDVDDKTIRDSNAAGQTLKEFTEFYTKEFHRESEKLNILPPTTESIATEHINEMVAMIETLLEKGFAYKGADGSVYFDIAKNPEYGKLSGLDKNKSANSQSRIKNDEYDKENAQDFALWKAWDESDSDVFWKTSLGKGRPGWHIECSAMSTKYLGAHFDIHTGGIDLEFPHHENEIAQSECATGSKFVNYWLHNGHVLIDGKKMSKSLKNDYRLADLEEKGFSAIDYRYFLLGANYRNLINFTWESLEASKNALKKLKNIFLDFPPKTGSVNKDFEQKFTEALEDNLNTPEALAVLWNLAHDKEISEEDKRATMLRFDEVLGLGMKTWQKDEIPKEVLALAKERNTARLAKDFAKSDELRAKIANLGYEIKDLGEDFEIKKA
jgi:cysteinyl-tRNA synthetase